MEKRASFNASTFACREVSTKAHMYAGVAADIGALSGSLHGGANAQVMGMLLGLEYIGQYCGLTSCIYEPVEMRE